MTPLLKMVSFMAHISFDQHASHDTLLPASAASPGLVVKPPSPGTTFADGHVGGKIRERRLALGLSQQQLAGMIGVTYQQAHKYERGLNRISAGRLYDIAEALAVPIAWFFDGLNTKLPAETPPAQRHSLEMARNFAAIDNQEQRDALAQMARTLAAQSLQFRASSKQSPADVSADARPAVETGHQGDL